MVIFPTFIHVSISHRNHNIVLLYIFFIYLCSSIFGTKATTWWCINSIFIQQILCDHTSHQRIYLYRNLDGAHQRDLNKTANAVRWLCISLFCSSLHMKCVKIVKIIQIYSVCVFCVFKIWWNISGCATVRDRWVIANLICKRNRYFAWLT